jgi:hypothetical protein
VLVNSVLLRASRVADRGPDGGGCQIIIRKTWLFDWLLLTFIEQYFIYVQDYDKLKNKNYWYIEMREGMGQLGKQILTTTEKV